LKNECENRQKDVVNTKKKIDLVQEQIEDDEVNKEEMGQELDG